jgi:hypothetical protein
VQNLCKGCTKNISLEKEISAGLQQRIGLPTQFIMLFCWDRFLFVYLYSILILSNYHFVVAAQLLIYVGAINVLIIFAVMFMNALFIKEHMTINFIIKLG